VHAGLAYIATADATAMSAEERARCLREMEQADSVATAARTSVLTAFAAGQVRLRARGHCEWAGGCSQPAGACQVHHVKHLADGGPTSLTGCVLLCFYHHQLMIHQRGWTLIVNPDGTTTAWNKDKTKVLHSHGPPARAG